MHRFRAQRELCRRHGAEFVACDLRLKMGIDRGFSRDQFPINGLRHRPQGDTSGWYIWSGERFSDAADFLVPLHGLHLEHRCPEAINFLGLAPGWRFLLAPDQEEVWFDEALLVV